MSRGKINCRFASKHVLISLLFMHIIIKLKKCVQARRELRRTVVLLAVKQFHTSLRSVQTVEQRTSIFSSFS